MLTGKRMTGSLEILLATVIWGYGYVVIRDSLDMIPLSFLMTSRYLTAFMVLALIFVRKLGKMTGQALADGAVLGVFLCIGQYFQTWALGCEDTTAGKVAFITALYVVLVPFLQWALWKKRPGKKCLFSVLLALPGLLLLTGTGNTGIGKGDFLALAGSLGFTVHILAADRFTEQEDTILLTVLQFGFAALAAGAVQLLAGVSFPLEQFCPAAIWPLIYLGIFSTMCGFLLQLLGQEKLPPAVSAVLLAMESVFGMFFSVVLLGEHLTMGSLAGCVLMFAAVFLAGQKRDAHTGETK